MYDQSYSKSDLFSCFDFGISNVITYAGTDVPAIPISDFQARPKLRPILKLGKALFVSI